MTTQQPSLFEGERLRLDNAIELSLDSLRAYGEHYPHWAVAYSGGNSFTRIPPAQEGPAGLDEFVTRGYLLAMQVRCPECSRIISDTATACPSCGYVITPAMAERMRTAATMPLLRRRSTWIAWGCIALFVATVAYCASLPEPPLTPSRIRQGSGTSRSQ